MNQKQKSDLEVITNLLGHTAMTYVMGLAFVSQIRETAKVVPVLKPQIIKALELLIQELKQKP